MIPGDGHSHQVEVLRPSDGRALVWNTYPNREAADAERIKLAKIGMFAVVRRIVVTTAPEGTK